MIYTYLLNTGCATAELKQKMCSYFKYNLFSKWFEAIVNIIHSSLLAPVTSTASVRCKPIFLGFYLTFYAQTVVSGYLFNTFSSLKLCVFCWSSQWCILKVDFCNGLLGLGVSFLIIIEEFWLEGTFGISWGRVELILKAELNWGRSWAICVVWKCSICFKKGNLYLFQTSVLCFNS